MSNLITTYSKIHLDPVNPHIESIKLKDIAHALSLMCRANGHFKTFYSVAQHCINCAHEAKARGLSTRIQFACLLHDASEAYLSDITRPVKSRLPSYVDIEKTMQNAIWTAFSLNGLTAEELANIEEIDDALLYYEFLSLMDEKTAEKEPLLCSKPDFTFRNFTSVENEFLSIANMRCNQQEKAPIDTQDLCIGIDGCKGGWICAVLNQEGLLINRFSTLNHIVQMYPNFKSILIDMPIGLQSKSVHVRPDSFARKIIRERSSTIFPAPCRQAVYAQSVSDAYQENERVLGKKFTPLTVGIIPKIREVDLFLQNNPAYKNKILESHPEVCFSVLNRKTVLSKKSQPDGIEERIKILQKYLPYLNLRDVSAPAKQHKCNVDDVVDAICLAVSANFVVQNQYRTLPSQPMVDETGLYMQMVIPKLEY